MFFPRSLAVDCPNFEPSKTSVILGVNPAAEYLLVDDCVER